MSFQGIWIELAKRRKINMKKLEYGLAPIWTAKSQSIGHLLAMWVDNLGRRETVAVYKITVMKHPVLQIMVRSHKVST